MNDNSITHGFSQLHQQFLAHSSGAVTFTAARGLEDDADWAKYIGALLDQAAANLRDAIARGQPLPSPSTWLLRSATAHSANNDSPEKLLEKRIVQLSDGWFNQVPVAPGLTDSYADNKRCVDLAYHFVDREHLDLVELKVGSDNPLAAAVELLEYLCIYLLCRRRRGELGLADRPALSVRSVRALVLAPAKYYDRHAEIMDKLRLHQRKINVALHTLLTPQDPALVDFAFYRFPPTFEWDPSQTSSETLRDALRGIEPV